MEKLIKKFTDLIKEFGNRGILHTFEYCANYGIELDGSTIDAIVIDGNSVIFYYNENTDDWDDITAFSQRGLENFYEKLDAIFHDNE